MHTNKRNWRLLFGLIGAVASAAMCLLGGSRVRADSVPDGYSPKVVLHVDYGKTPDKIRVDWGSEETDPTSLQGIRVMGNRIYFLDDVADRVKQYHTSGKLVWETKSLDNLHYYAVAPDGKIYAVWGAGLEMFSCIDSSGNLVWAKDLRNILSDEKSKAFGMRHCFQHFSWIEWTRRGAAIDVLCVGDKGSRSQCRAFVDGQGDLVGILPGALATTDGTSYAMHPENPKDTSRNTYTLREIAGATLIGRDAAGKIVKKLRLDLTGKRVSRLAEDAVFTWIVADPTGGFCVYGYARLPARARFPKGLSSGLEEVLWRSNAQGKFKEEWRFVHSPFASRLPEVVVAPDGCVYHLKFGEKGIEVIKYSPTKKGKQSQGRRLVVRGGTRQSPG